jgi:hypothetical protein
LLHGAPAGAQAQLGSLQPKVDTSQISPGLQNNKQLPEQFAGAVCEQVQLHAASE